MGGVCPSGPKFGARAQQSACVTHSGLRSELLGTCCCCCRCCNSSKSAPHPSPLPFVGQMHTAVLKEREGELTGCLAG
eukprot:COSAG02_NODE_9097_length_2332_cov_2.069413_2_plen_78_part_00